MHQSYQHTPEPMYHCYEFGHWFFEVYRVGNLVNFCCDKCEMCITMSDNAIEEADYAIRKFGINLWE